MDEREIDKRYIMTASLALDATGLHVNDILGDVKQTAWKDPGRDHPFHGAYARNGGVCVCVTQTGPGMPCLLCIWLFITADIKKH